MCIQCITHDGDRIGAVNKFISQSGINGLLTAVHCSLGIQHSLHGQAGICRHFLCKHPAGCIHPGLQCFPDIIR